MNEDKEKVKEKINKDIDTLIDSISKTINSSASFSLNILIALIGSPIYLNGLKFFVLTKPLSLINKQGIILDFSIY